MDRSANNNIFITTIFCYLMLFIAEVNNIKRTPLEEGSIAQLQ
jgi:hypothetical protein